MFKRNPKIDSKSYIHTRKAHESELAEDYVELIEDLINKEGEARIVDIANHLGISKATANQTLWFDGSGSHSNKFYYPTIIVKEL